MAIRSSGRDAPSRKLKAEREWSSMNIALAGGIFALYSP
jgi:hypothetical protein